MNFSYIYLCCVVIATPMTVMTNLKPAIADSSVSLAAEVPSKKPIGDSQNSKDNNQGNREGFPSGATGGGTR